MMLTITSKGIGAMAESIAERDWLRRYHGMRYDDGGLYVIAPASARNLKIDAEAAGFAVRKLTSTADFDHKVGLELETDR